ncbi:hypothetical protein Tco_0656937 [Tanacetum coccineum]|uniref:Uncharacterized protein n=1 Tax=Tanacetum coccineum TaxID=301880 RepID=A0ABQ4XAW5_9ASTR
MQMKILKEACMEECNPALCPMEPGLKLSNAEDEPEVEATQYRKMDIVIVVIMLTMMMDEALLYNSFSTLVHRPITCCSYKKLPWQVIFGKAEFMAATAAACQAILA